MVATSDFTDLGIHLRNPNAAQQKVKCPNCVKVGKKNVGDTCLSINMTEGLYNCHKCSWSGVIKTNKANTIIPMVQSKQYKKPTKDTHTKASKKAIDFLLSRGITKEVIEANGIQSSKCNRNIVFPYFMNGEMINYKTRGVDGKFFTQAKDARAVIYNYDRVKVALLFVKERLILCLGKLQVLKLILL